MNFKNWTFPIAIAHIILPAIGYYGWWFLGQYFHGLSVALGLLAFAIISTFLQEEICEWIDAKPIVSLEPVTTLLFKHLESVSRGRLLMVFAVSMDALWSGPAKAAQAESEAWKSFEVFASFFVAGSVVALVAELALLAAYILKRITLNNTRLLAIYLVCGKYAEASILSAFGILSLWNGLSAWIGLGTLRESLALSSAFFLFIWLDFWQRLVDVQITNFTEK
jgi:hypothetical protein